MFKERNWLQLRLCHDLEVTHALIVPKLARGTSNLVGQFTNHARPARVSSSRNALLPDLRLVVLIVHKTAVEMVKWLKPEALLAQNIFLEPPWQNFGDLIVHVSPGGYRKDVVELFQGSLFGLWDPKEDHDERRHVERT